MKPVRLSMFWGSQNAMETTKIASNLGSATHLLYFRAYRLARQRKKGIASPNNKFVCSFVRILNMYRSFLSVV